MAQLSRPVVVAGAIALAATAAAPAMARDALTLSPSRAEGTARPGVLVGPFELSNGSDSGFRTRLVPVLLGQHRDGGVFVRTDAAGLARARRLLRVGRRSFALAPGRRLAVHARLRRPDSKHSFYGGVLARNEPAGGRSSTTLRQVFQLTASLMLQPPRRLRRPQLAADGLRVEQAGPRRLRFLAGVVNRGNVHLRPAGLLRVRDPRGRLVLRRPLRSPSILPGAVVDARARTGPTVLPAGRYRAIAVVRAGSRRRTMRAAFRLVGPNSVAARRGRLTGVHTGYVAAGEPVDVSSTWRNTGNVAFRPRAVVEVRELERGGLSARRQVVALQAATVPPGARGEARGKLRLPDSGTFELTYRLLDGRRELDRRTASVTPQSKPELLDRLEAWLRAKAPALVAALVALLLACAVGFAARERRLRAELARRLEPGRAPAGGGSA